MSSVLLAGNRFVAMFHCAIARLDRHTVTYRMSYYRNVAPTDIDECRNDVCGEHADCKNTPGSYRCECCVGYKMVGGVCVGKKMYCMIKQEHCT